MEYRIDGETDAEFVALYERVLLEKCGLDELPNPFSAEHGVFHNFRPWELGQVWKHGNFRESDVVLDAGAMHTYFCIFLSQFVRRVVAVDNWAWADRSYVREEKLSSPAEWAAYVERRGNGRVKVEYADLMDLQYADFTFDKVLAVSVIEHVLDGERAMREMVRVLKPGGRLLLTTEFNSQVGKRYSEADGSFYRIYDPGSLSSLVKVPGLRITTPFVVSKEPRLPVGKFVQAFVIGERRR